MAKPQPPLKGDWLLLTSARSGNEGKGLLIHAGDIFAVHEGPEPGTTLIEFEPEKDRQPELIYKPFLAFVKDYASSWDARGRRPRKKKGPAEASPQIVRLHAD